MARFNLVKTHDSTHSIIIDKALSLVQDYLTKFALNEDFLDQVELAFGNPSNLAKLEELRQQWASGQFEAPPEIEVCQSPEINGAFGAFSADTNKIYLSQEFINQDTSGSGAIADVLLEEYGHFVDAQINVSDARGDEGEIFSAVVRGVRLDERAVQMLKTESDLATIFLNGEIVQIEQAANETTVSGKIFWIDGLKNKQPVRDSKVEILTTGNFPEILKTTHTNFAGKYEANIPAGIQAIRVRVLTESSTVMNSKPIHIIQRPDEKTSHSFVSDLLNVSSQELLPILIDEADVGFVDVNAFSINDVIYAGELYANLVRQQQQFNSLNPLEITFPAIGEPARLIRGKDRIKIPDLFNGILGINWDIGLHEYGHFLARTDGLDNSPGGSHALQVSNITGGIKNTIFSDGTTSQIVVPAYGKLNGIQLGWGEGLANYLSIAAQILVADKLPKIPYAGNTVFNDAADGGFDLESQKGLETKGEGDEGTVARILFHLADGTRENHDRISIGHKNLYGILKKIPNLDSLGDVWQYFYSSPKNLSELKLPSSLKEDNAKLTKLGAIFEEYGVSPHLTGITFGSKLLLPNENKELPNFKLNDKSNLPVIKWEKGNNNANDSFQVIVFNSDFSKFVLPLQQLGNVTQWQATQDGWNTIVTTPGEYHIVITGGDFEPGSENQFKDGSPETGPYWSGAYTFTVGDAAPKKVPIGAFNNGLNLDIFQSKNQQLLTSLPIFGSVFNSSSSSGQTIQSNQLLAANEVSEIGTDTEISETQFLLSEVSAAAETSGLNFLGNLSNDIKNKFIQKFGDATEATVDEIQDAFFELLGSSGQGILKDSDDPGEAITKDDIGIIIDGSIVQFNIKLGGQENLADISLPSNLGLPWLGFEFNDPNNPDSSPKVAIDLDYTFDLGFGIDITTSEFFFETSPNKDLTIALTPSFPDATAKLGFLQVEAQNRGSKLEFSVDIDDGEDGNDQLTLDEIATGNLRFTPNGSANLDLHLDSSIASSTLLPSISTDLNLDWNFTEDTTTPTVSFDNVELKLGSFFKTLAVPALSGIQTVIEPLQNVTQLLKTNLPIIKKSISELAQTPGLSTSNQNIQKFLTEVPKIATLIESIPKNLDQLDAIPINLGSFDIPNIDTSASDLSNGTPTANPDKQPAEPPLKQVDKVQSNFVTQLNETPSFTFPILTEPENVINLLLGKEADLFKAELPLLGLGFEYTQIIPIFGPIVATITVEAGAAANLGFGVDSQGLFAYTPQGQQSQLLSDFPSLVNHTVGLTTRTSGGGGISVGAVTANVDAGIEGNLFLDLSQSKTRLSDLSNLDCVLTTSGNISAVVAAKLKIGWGPFSYRKRIELIRETLADFRRDSCSGLEEDHGQAVVANGNLTLSVGEAAKNLKDIDFSTIQNKDNEFIFVEHTSGTLGNETVTVAAYDTTWSYRSINQITSDGGQGDDVILLGDKVLTKAKLTGGEGRDELQGGAGNDELQGDTERDILLGGAGNDDLQGGAEDDRLLGDGKPPSEDEAQDNPGNNELLGNDKLRGDSGDDELLGGHGNDELRGGSENDFLDGGSGDDHLFGEDGDDILQGRAGADTLEGGAGKDSTSYKDSPSPDGVNGVRLNLSNRLVSIRLSNGQSIALAAKSASGGDAEGDKFDGSIEDIEGSDYADVLIGDDSTVKGFGNVLDGGKGDDILLGGQGDDLLFGGKGVDTFDGGEGEDGTTYLDSPAEVFINLETGKGSSGDAEGEKLINIEDVQGSKYNDILIGNDSKNNLDGSVGDDRLTGNGKADVLDGSEGNDWAIYESSPEAVNISLKEGKGKDFGPVNLNGGDGKGDTLNSIENLEGSAHDDILEGDSGQNIIKGLNGNDTLKGDSGNDTIIGGAGGDTLDGGDGIDWADYSDSPTAVTVVLQVGGFGGDAQGDTFIQPNGKSTVENLLGSNFADALFGDDGDNEINPGLSNSQNNEFDVVDGGGGTGNDLLTLNYSFNDIGTGLFGGFTGSYIGFGSGLGFFRKTSDESRFLDAVAFSNIEHLKIIGTIQDDEIYGGAGNDTLLPGDGNDTVYGGDGNNTIYGDDDNDYLVSGNGNDTLSGGAGNDTVHGGLGSNTINADDGNDVVIDQDVNGELIGFSSSSKTYLDGGRGIDTLSIDLSARDDNNPYPYGDITLVSLNPSQESTSKIELLNGSVIANFEIFKNVRTGISADKIIQLGRVDNVIKSGSGSDIVNPGLGFDDVDGGYFDSDQGSGSDTLILDYSVDDTGTGIFADIPSHDPFFGGSYYRYKDGRKVDLLDQIEFRNFTRYEIIGTRKDDLIIGGGVGGVGGDILIGGAGNDTIHGGKGDDEISAGDDDDILIGINSNLDLSDMGGDGIDALTGGAGLDEFWIGDSEGIYYADAADKDYAIIKDLSPNEGDILQLHGSIDNYSLEITPTSTGIYLEQQDDPYQPRELIAIVEGINLDLTADYIRYVTSDTETSNLAQNTNSSAIAVDQTDSLVTTTAASQDNSNAITTLNKLEEPISAVIPSQSENTSTIVLNQAEVSASVFDLTQNNNSQQLLENLLGDRTGLSNFKIGLVGDGRAFGTFKNDPFSLGSGVAISTGRVTDLDDSNSEDGGFTQSGRQDLSQDFAEAGTLGDSISLKIEFDADATKEFLFFQYVFGSEEFAEFGGSPFNDNFSLTLNGFNFARLSDGSTVSINNLVPSPLGAYHPDFIYNPAQTGSVSGQTKLDGYTKPLLFQAPLVQNGKNTLVINVQDVNDGIFDSAVFIKGGTVGTKLPTTKTLDGKDGQKSISVNAGDGTIEIDNFGGVGRGVNPSSATIAEVDTITLTDARLTARKMLLNQNGSNLEITFEGVANTKVVLTNLGLENLDNLRKETGASVNLGNILFPEQTEIQDSYDVVNAESQLSQIPNRNTVTFLNDLSNTIKGLSKSNDVINGQGGNDQIDGLSGDDLLRGGTGNDILLGNKGEDTLVGGIGSDQLIGGDGGDRFVLAASTGTDTITDFQDNQDRISLLGITFAQITVAQGSGVNRNDTLISLNNGSSTELLAILAEVRSSIITSADFITVQRRLNKFRQSNDMWQALPVLNL